MVARSGTRNGHECRVCPRRAAGRRCRGPCAPVSAHRGAGPSAARAHKGSHVSGSPLAVRSSERCDWYVLSASPNFVLTRRKRSLESGTPSPISEVMAVALCATLSHFLVRAGTREGTTRICDATESHARREALSDAREHILESVQRIGGHARQIREINPRTCVAERQQEGREEGEPEHEDGAASEEHGRE